jgi:Asp-tRNA(Asn)/Glu-tRNA(Gln) amidotransferase A subunit family amidase
VPGMQLASEQRPVKKSWVIAERPPSDDELAFMTVAQLSELLSARELSSMELTKLYLRRLKEFDPLLHCVVSLTEELALQQARRADEEIAQGHYRGPLHGIPWGAKDLFAVKGTRTTWGASPFRDQTIDVDSTVYTRLTEAGAVLVAKLTLGALATGDRWFGGQTRCPWNPEVGSSGSSAGSGAATAAGLVGFAIGTETTGSLISPSHRNGITGLRPSFGRVSRHGAMSVSWTVDKVGPMCRSAEDCALVFAAIQGPDLIDRSVLDVPFNWDGSDDVSKLRVGYTDTPATDLLEALDALGVKPKQVPAPTFSSADFGSLVQGVEAAAGFDDLSRSGRDLPMRAAPEFSGWPDSYRIYRFVPAVEYVQAQRARTLTMQAVEQYFEQHELDVLIGSLQPTTNFTGQPELSLPWKLDQRQMPTSVQLTGRLFGEREILLLAHGIQNTVDHHLQHPAMR